MTRMVLAGMMVGALLLGWAPNAVAEEVSEEIPVEIAADATFLEEALEPVGEVAEEVVGPLPAPQVLADEPLPDPVAIVEELTGCRTAVKVTLDLFGGDLTDTRHTEVEFLATRHVVYEQLREVPVYETVRETASQQAGPLMDRLAPVTQEVEKLTGYDVQRFVVEGELDLAVAAEWDEVYIEWEHILFTVYVTLPVGAPYLATGEGVVERVCDPDTPILTIVPGLADHEYWAPNPLGADPCDGWIIQVFSAEVRLANAADLEALEAHDVDGLLIDSEKARERIQESIDGFQWTPGMLTEQGRVQELLEGSSPDPLPPLPTGGDEGAPDAPVAPASTATAMAGPAGRLLEIAALMGVGLALTGGWILRRK